MPLRTTRTLFVPAMPDLSSLHEADQAEGKVSAMTIKHTSTLNEVIVAYLWSLGFHYYDRDGVRYFGHRSLGEGRTFTDAVEWAIGCEQAGRDLRAEAQAA